MTTQRLHSAMAPIDVLTRLELESELHKGFDNAIRDRYRGLDSLRFSRTMSVANATTYNLFANPNESPCGPEQGDCLMLRRAIVKSNVFTDTARYILFRGSSPSDINNAFDGAHLLDGFSITPGVTQVVVPSPAIGTSPSTYVNTNLVPVVVTIAGGTVSAIAVNGQTITGVTSGSFDLQPGSYITVTYSVAPTTYTIVNALSSTSTVMGLNVNVGYYPSNKSLFLQPGEQIYALINNATIGNTYYLDGEGIRIPAEMKGKVL